MDRGEQDGWLAVRPLHRIIVVLLLLPFTLGPAGCTDQKAQALETAADSFSTAATAAIQTLHSLFQNDVAASFPADEQGVDDVLASLENLGADKLNSSLFSEVLKGSYVTADSLAGDNEFEKLDSEYREFAAMYGTLRTGRLFAGQAVKQSEPVATRLTVQMIAFAQHVKDFPYQLRARRIVLIDKINRALKVQDAEARKATLRDLAQQTIQLRNDEQNANQAAIRECLKAAAAGKSVIEAIRSYGKLSVGDILNLAQGGLQFAAQISNSRDISSVLSQYIGVENMIRNDPYWGPMLNLAVTKPGEDNGRQ
jgi:hypothetical protein